MTKHKTFDSLAQAQAEFAERVWVLTPEEEAEYRRAHSDEFAECKRALRTSEETRSGSNVA